jgi:hypothetical protein
MMKEGIMKSKIWSILAVFILVLIISSTGLYAQRFAGRGYTVLTQEVEPAYSLNRLREIFNRRSARLTAHFNAGRFKPIANYYGPRGWIKTHKGNLVEGKAEIEAYLSELHRIGSTLDVFLCIEVFIDFDSVLNDSPSNNPPDDPVYPIRENIVIYIDIKVGSPYELDSSAYSRHSRRTFD